MMVRTLFSTPLGCDCWSTGHVQRSYIRSSSYRVISAADVMTGYVYEQGKTKKAR